MKLHMQLKNGLYLLSVVTVIASVVTHAKAECSGTRPSCLTLGGHDIVSCAKHEGCSQKDSTAPCEGTPRACNTFPTYSLCYSKGCNWDGPIDVIDKGGEPIGTYKGTATMDLKYYDYNYDMNQYAFRGQTNTEYPAVVYISTPQKDDLQEESNPFNLQFFDDTDNANLVEGHIWMTSATVVITPITGRNLMLQYWDLNLNGNKIEGELIDTHSSESAAINMVNVKDDSLGVVMVTIGLIQVGTKLTGTLTPTSADLEINNDVYPLGSTDKASFEFKFKGSCEHQQVKKVATSQNAYSNICSSSYQWTNSDSEDAMTSSDSEEVMTSSDSEDVMTSSDSEDVMTNSDSEDSIDGARRSLGFGLVGYFLSCLMKRVVVLFL